MPLSLIILLVFVSVILVALVLARVFEYKDRPRVRVIDDDGMYYIQSRVLCLFYLTEEVRLSYESAVIFAEHLARKPARPRQVWP